MSQHYTSQIAHRNDPASSHAAAREVTDSGQRDTHCAVVLDAVKAHPGLTSAELVEHVPGLGITEIRRRLTDLKDAGLILQGETRICTVGKRKMVVWRFNKPRNTNEIKTRQASLFE